MWYGSGFITQIIYATGVASADDQFGLLTENNFNILTENNQDIDVEN